MGYPLQALLAVRQYREDCAKNAVRAAEGKCREARAAVAACEAELARYRQWRPEEESRRYAAILGKEMPTEDLAAFRSALTDLGTAELAREQAVHEATQAQLAAENALAEAHAAVVAARKEAAKIEIHQEKWLEEQRKVAERQEDLELEEASSPFSRHNSEADI